MSTRPRALANDVCHRLGCVLKLMCCRNTAIGSGAQFSPANLFTPAARHPTQFHNDQDFFLRVTAADPLTDWVDQGDWGGDNHCHVTGKVATQIRLPRNWTSASDCGTAPDRVGDRAGGHCCCLKEMAFGSDCNAAPSGAWHAAASGIHTLADCVARGNPTIIAGIWVAFFQACQQ